MKPLEVAVSAAIQAGKILFDSLGRLKANQIKSKQLFDYVTKVDQDSERIIVDLIRSNFPTHSILAEEAGEFAMTDVLRHINEKLIRRHPHVFGDAEISNHEEVSLKWEEIKRMECEDSKSLLDGIPCNIPALAYSQIIQQRTARIGFDWDTIDGVLEKVTEELEEFRKAETHQQKVHEFGDLMLALSNTARWMGIDLESALQQANQRFCQRFSCMEKISHQRGISMNRLSLTQLDALWEEAKSLLADSHDDDP